MLASVLQLAGLVLFVAAVWLWIPLLGLAALGAAVFGVGLLLED